ncbi:MAG: hypothetical protein WAX14_08490 [Rhodococcus sp. (in: high G+C Gram-positive bacteria)]|uniref:hypothetical protein n=1 Tax=Rhodococcus sp. TaxID=1831 RepID=UPI003BB4D806
MVGPFYDTGGLTRWWSISRQAVNKAVATDSVIACRLADDGQWVYPTWQFTDTGTVHPNLITLWRTLRGAADPWTCAVWLRNSQPELGDRSAHRERALVVLLRRRRPVRSDTAAWHLLPRVRRAHRDPGDRRRGAGDDRRDQCGLRR